MPCCERAASRRAGIRCRGGALLHAKIGLFDGELVLGSANWTLSGRGVNHELDVDPIPWAVRAYLKRFDSDWTRSSP